MSNHREDIDTFTIIDITGTLQFELCGLMPYIEKCIKGNTDNDINAFEEGDEGDVDEDLH